MADTYGTRENTNVNIVEWPNDVGVPIGYEGAPIIKQGQGLLVNDGTTFWNTSASRNARLKTLVLGNSITVQAQVSGTALLPTVTARSETHVANFLAEGCLEFPETTAIPAVASVSGAVSRDSHYGFSGGTSAQILADLSVTLAPILTANGVAYDFVWIHAWNENDANAGLTTEQSIRNLKQIMAWCRARYPKCLFLIAVCRPSSFINTPTEIATQLATNAAVVALNNYRDIRVYSPGEPYVSADSVSPVVIKVSGSASSGTMVIDNIISNPTNIDIQPGMQVGSPAFFVTSANATREGTYGVSVGLTKAGIFNIFPYTDGDAATELGGVHPNGLGTGEAARQALPHIRAFAGRISDTSSFVSVTPGFSGSNAQSAVSGILAGTRATNITITAGAGTVLPTATNPGQLLEYSGVPDATTSSELAWLTFTSFTLPTVTDAFRIRLVLKIEEGAKYVARLDAKTRQTDNGSLVANTVWYSAGSGGGSTGVEYQDNDVWTLVSPVIRSTGAGTLISALLGYLSVYCKAKTPTTAAIRIRLIGLSYELVRDGSEIATLVGGTVTISDARVRTGSRIRYWHVINGGTVGVLLETARVPGTSVTISSFTTAGAANAADTSQIRYCIDN